MSNVVHESLILEDKKKEAPSRMASEIDGHDLPLFISKPTFLKNIMVLNTDFE